MKRRDDLSGIDWTEVVGHLASRGWMRLKDAVAPDKSEALERAAAGPWFAVPESEGSAGVRQAGLGYHSAVDGAADVVRWLAAGIHSGIESADVPGIAPLPTFNHAEWCRGDRGRKFVTPHRDPDTAGGVIAVLTLQGRAVFRIWDLEGSLTEAQSHPELAATWETEDGDLVLMRAGGWPLPISRCPIHAAESPLEGDRVTLTLRHNTGGYGADYFA